MQYPNLLKRIVPFALALILGLFVASFFVSLTPSVRFRGRMFREMKHENRALKMEIERLQSELEEARKKNSAKCEEAEYKHFKLYKEEAEVDISKARSKDKRNSPGAGHGYGEDSTLKVPSKP